LLLIFIALLFSKRKSTLIAQAGILGLMFTFHAPTGLTLSMGAVPYFLWKLTTANNWAKDFIKYATAYFAGASFFLFNFWFNSPKSVLLTSTEKSFLYDFVFYRYPDTYPQVIWRIFTNGDLELAWVAHIALFAISLLALWGIIKKNGVILLSSTGVLLCYIYGFVAIPLALFIFWVSFRNRENLESSQTSTWSLALIAYGAFFVCTWLQWGYDIYNAAMRTPPFLIDNSRFISALFPFAFVLFAVSVRDFKKWGLLIATYGILTLPLIFPLFDPMYHNLATKHNVKLRAQYDFNPNFSLTASDHEKVLKFARNSHKDSLFLYYGTNTLKWWTFRLHTRRSIAINRVDIGFMYVAKKHKLVNDWLVFTKILELYRNRDLEGLCKTTKELSIDFIIFPKVETTDSSCFEVLLDMESGAIYKHKSLAE